MCRAGCRGSPGAVRASGALPPPPPAALGPRVFSSKHTDSAAEGSVPQIGRQVCPGDVGLDRTHLGLGGER